MGNRNPYDTIDWRDGTVQREQAQLRGQNMPLVTHRAQPLPIVPSYAQPTFSDAAPRWIVIVSLILIAVGAGVVGVLGLTGVLK